MVSGDQDRAADAAAALYSALAVSLRSIVLPVKAVLMNLLTVGAHGVLVMVFQWGWLDGLLGHHSLGFIHSMTLLLAFVFGLSMDYEVLVFRRIPRELPRDGRAVAFGLSQSAGTIHGRRANYGRRLCDVRGRQRALL